MSKPSHHLVRRVALIVAGVLVALVVAAGFALDPLVARATRRALDSQPGLHGNFARVSVSPFRFAYHLEGLTVREDPDRGHPPVLVAKDIRVQLRWRSLLKGHLVADAEVAHAKVTLRFDTPEQIREAIHRVQEIATMTKLGHRLAELPPFLVDRLEIREAELLLEDRTEPDVAKKSAEIWVHQVAGTVDHLATRPEFTHRQPAHASLTGELQHSGKVSLDSSVNPFGNQLELTLKASVKELELRELYGFMAPATGLQAAEGNLAAFLEVHLQEGTLDGAVKVLFDHLKLAAAKANLGNDLKAMAANAAVNAATHKEAEGQEVAVVVPIKGTVKDPKVDVFGAITDAIHNANEPPLKPDFSGVAPAKPAKQPSKRHQGKAAPIPVTR
jgi:hypothetical protein